MKLDPTGELRERADALWQGLFPLMQAEGSAAGVYADKVAALALIESCLDGRLPASPIEAPGQDEAAAEITALRARVEELTEALRPFADASAHLPDDVQDFKVVAHVPGGHNAAAFDRTKELLTAGNFRAARRALAKGGE